jgi:hypothetical protein
MEGLTTEEIAGIATETSDNCLISIGRKYPAAAARIAMATAFKMVQDLIAVSPPEAQPRIKEKFLEFIEQIRVED